MTFLLLLQLLISLIDFLFPAEVRVYRHKTNWFQILIPLTAEPSRGLPAIDLQSIQTQLMCWRPMRGGGGGGGRKGRRGVFLLLGFTLFYFLPFCITHRWCSSSPIFCKSPITPAMINGAVRWAHSQWCLSLLCIIPCFIRSFPQHLELLTVKMHCIDHLAAVRYTLLGKPGFRIHVDHLPKHPCRSCTPPAAPGPSWWHWLLPAWRWQRAGGIHLALEDALCPNPRKPDFRLSQEERNIWTQPQRMAATIKTVVFINDSEAETPSRWLDKNWN